MSAAGSGKGLVRSASVPLGTLNEAFQPGRQSKQRQRNISQGEALRLTRPPREALRVGRLDKSASCWLAKPKRLGGRFLIITGPKGECGDSEG